MTAIRMGWPVTAPGRLGEVTNGRFVEFHRIKGESSRMTASGKVEGRLRVGLRQTPVEIRCRKPVIEVSLPETGRSSMSAGDLLC